jgi:hypothetical protein
MAGTDTALDGDRPPVESLGDRYAPHTWENNGSTYGSAPLDFTGPEPGCTHPYGRLPS